MFYVTIIISYYSMLHWTSWGCFYELMGGCVSVNVVSAWKHLTLEEQ